MLKNKYLFFLTTCLIIICIIVIALSNRFYIDSKTGFKVDRLTGKTYQIVNDEWDFIKTKTESSTTDTKSNKNKTIILDESVISCVFVLPEYDRLKLAVNDEDHGEYSYAERIRKLKEETEVNKRNHILTIKNLSTNYIIKTVEIKILLYKDEITFFSKTLSIDKDINPLCEIIDYYYPLLEHDMKYPDRPWSYTIEVIKVNGVPFD